MLWPGLMATTVPTVPTERCFLGNGTEYRGVASTAASGLSCLAWNSDLLYQELHVDSVGAAALLGLGPHAYCRSASNDYYISFCIGKGLDRVWPPAGAKLPRWLLTSAFWDDGCKRPHRCLQRKHIAQVLVWITTLLGVKMVLRGE